MSDFNRTLTVVCPVALLEVANHMVNCFESSYPASPVLNTPEDPESVNVTITVPCRESWLEKVQAVIAGWQNPALHHAILYGNEEMGITGIMPGWNQYVTDENEENGYWLVDMEKAAEALSQTVLGDPEGEAPADKIVLYTQ